MHIGRQRDPYAPSTKVGAFSSLQTRMRRLLNIIDNRSTRLSQYFLLHPVVKYTSISCLVLFLSASAVFLNHYQHIHSYDLSKAETALLGKSFAQSKKITQNQTSISFNLEKSNQTNKSAVVLASATNATGEAPYQATISKKSSDGIKFGDTTSGNNIKLTPNFKLSDAQLQPDGRVVYPGPSGSHQVYTFKRNGVKQDILLSKAAGDTLEYSWTMQIPSSLEAKLMSNGGVGFYSTNPELSNPSLQVGDSKTQQLLDNAKQNGAKDYLVYVIPAPFITETGKTASNYHDSNYVLKDNILTLKLKNLKDKTYPISIDPTVTVTTTADFATGTDDGMISYGTSNQIGRSTVSIGTVTGTWSTSSTFTAARDHHATVAYNGYLYVVGGESFTNSNDCTVGSFPYFCKGVQFAVINSNGTIGTWNYTANSSSCATFTASPCSSGGFTQTRAYHTSVAYNGYLYVMGGIGGASADDCTAASNYCKGVQFAAINSDGTIGTWNYTANSSSCATFTASPCSSGGFTQARYGHTSVAYNGYMYVIGGDASASGADCTGFSSYCNGAQYASINSDGTIGTWNTTTAFTQPRYGHTSVAYNGYMYVVGGVSSASAGDCTATTACAGVQYAPINSGGTLGTWAYTHNDTNDSTTYVSGFTQARYSHTSVAYNGYLYVIGGQSNSSLNDCTAGSNNCNGVQYAPINSNGTIGAWNSTTSITQARNGHTSIAYNGYLYVVGGVAGASGADCTASSNDCNGVQYNAFNTGTPSFGTAGNSGGTWNYTANSGSCATFAGAPCSSGGFTQNRRSHTSVAYNGFLYVIGGMSSTSANDCTASSNYCNGVQYAPINSNGTIGTWNTTTAFTQARYGHTSVAYNGYLYVIGGNGAASANDCTATINFCTGVQYATINSNGTIGAWHYTHSSTDDNTTYVSGFTRARVNHTSVAYNGYLYVIGGDASASGNDCTDPQAYCTGVQYATINSNGTIGSWNYTSASTNNGGTYSAGFTHARSGHTTAAYNGYLYVIGGQAGSTGDDCSSFYCTGVQFAAINSDGTIGTWAYTHASINDGVSYSAGFTTPRYLHTSVAYNGYLYVIGGQNGVSTGDCTSGTNPYHCTGIQYAAINSNGTIGAWGFTHDDTYDGTFYAAGFTQARSGHTSVVYNGYLYVTGGYSGASANDCTASSNFCTGIQYAQLTSPAQSGHYERTLDGGTEATWTTFTYNGTAPCGLDMTYRTAGTAGTFGSATTLPNIMPGVTYTLNVASTRYINLAFTLNGQSCGGITAITDATIVINTPPTAPTLTSPANAATGQARTPIFRFNSIDSENDYIQYEIQICTTSNCSSVIQTACQNSSLPNSCTGSQTGWSSQSLQSGTAYSSGQYAVYTYQGNLTPNTQYWWRAYAIDPGGVNTSSSASSIGTFTTLNPSTSHDLNFQGRVCFNAC